MNKWYVVSVLIIVCSWCNAQNLVPNPDFENTLPHNNCITGVEVAGGWFNPNVATPDLYSYLPTCSSSSFNNPSGYQLPNSGLCYVGLFTYQFPNTREYIEIKLLDSLTANQDYLVSFYISRAETFAIAADGMGAYFSNDTLITTTGYGNFQVVPQVKNPSGNILYDDLNWTQISGTYHATGGEKYLTIGNFADTTNTVIDTVPGGLYLSAYYYIDDVSVTIDSTTSLIENANNNVAVFPNPVSNVLHIKTGTNKPVEIIIYDLASRKIVHQKFSGNITINTEPLSKGIYVYELKNNFSILQKGKIVRN
jgi:Secretion system C-terminal sorting domain